MDLQAFQDEMAKIAVERSLMKDFLAGVDPTGTRTFSYGMKDAGKEKGVRSTVGAIGGLVGGATVVPAVVSGLIGGAQGFGKGGLKGVLPGFASGTYKPFAQLYRAAKGVKTLDKLDAGKKISKGELNSLSALVEARAPSITQQVRALAGDEAALKSVAQKAQSRLADAQKVLDPEIAKFVDKTIADTVRSAGEGVASKVKAKGFRSIVDRIVGSITGKTIDMAQKADIGRKATTEAGRAAQSRLSQMTSTPEGLEAMRRRMLDVARREGILSSGKKALKSTATETGAALALSSLISGGSAYLQYGKGARVGKSIAKEPRRSR